MPKNKFKGSNYLIDSNFHRQGWQGAAKAATGIAPLKKYISQKAGSFEEQNRGVENKPQNKTKASPKTSPLFYKYKLSEIIPKVVKPIEKFRLLAKESL